MLDNNADKNLIKYLFIIAISLVLLNVIDLLLGHPSWQIYRFIDVNEEANFTSWFSSIILAIAALYAYSCSVAVKSDQKEKRIWQIMSLGLLFMSCDEVAMIHENTALMLNKYVIKSSLIKNAQAFAFILGPIILPFVIWFTYKLKQILNKSMGAKRLLLIGITMYFLGAIGLESTAGLFYYNKLMILFKIEYLLEELFEMVGVIIIIKGIREYYKYLYRPSEAIN